MSSFWSQPHLWSSPQHLTPDAWATLFLDHSFSIPPLLGCNHIGFLVVGWEFLFSDTPARTGRTKPQRGRGSQRWEQDRYKMDECS